MKKWLMIMGCVGFMGSCEAAMITTQVPDKGQPLVVVDAQDNTNLMPSQFRTSSDNFAPALIRKELAKQYTLPSRKGLDQLNFSASAQFSESSLRNLINVTGQDLCIVDLRLESHGFGGGHAVSLYAPQNAINQGFSPQVALQREEAFLAELERTDPAFLRLIMDKDDGQICAGAKVVSKFCPVESEEALVARHGVGYVRFATLDHARPSDEVVDAFVAFVTQAPARTKLHFHCRAGKGRTTQFLALYDMLKNAKNVSFEDIVTRQHLIGGSPLTNISDDEEVSWKKQLSQERLAFLKAFYLYAKDPGGYGVTTWSQWHRKNAPAEKS
ncbi:MAG: phosphatase [Candidatus Puniceispirillum sp.]|nr:phosphatase [Candidatus Puniceispirillum sp.]